jgi:phosphotransferase system HPr-like phosphotransfer protein
MQTFLTSNPPKFKQNIPLTNQSVKSVNLSSMIKLCHMGLKSYKFQLAKSTGFICG